MNVFAFNLQSITGNDTSHNASSIRSLPDVLLYFHAGLDPKRSYTLTVSNVDPGKLLSVKSILLFEQQLKNAQTTSMNKYAYLTSSSPRHTLTANHIAESL